MALQPASFYSKKAKDRKPMIERLNPKETHDLMQNESYVYVDVRSQGEFDQGHPEGAVNIPFLFANPGGGMQENPDFVKVVKATYPMDAKLVLGCAAGGRSIRAAQILMQEGYLNLRENRCGYSGARNMLGMVKEAGWEGEGLPVSTDAAPECSYDSLSKKAEG